MQNDSPENLFGISEKDDISSTNKGMNLESSEEKPEENLIPKTKDMTLEDLKSYLQKNNVVVNEQNIQNYYNQIIKNKKVVNEYNQEIKKLEEAKDALNKRGEDNKTNQGIDTSVNSKLSEIEKKLADLNVEKQKNEDGVKSVIKNIFNENKTENSKNNINFETKNNLLNMTLNGVQEPVVEQKKEETVQNPDTKEEKKENSDVKEFLQEPEKKENSDVKEFLQEPEKKEEDVKINTPLEETKKEENIENIPESDKAETDQNPISNMGKVETEKVPSGEVGGESNQKNKTDESISDLSETMKKGFESVLNAIKGISREGQTQKEAPKAEEPAKQENSKSPQDAQNKTKTPQKNYIEEYRESLRSNAPIKGFVGIKGLQLKANNIGSYL